MTWKSSKVQNIGEDEDKEQSVTVSNSVGNELCTDTVQLRATVLVLVPYRRNFLSGRLNVIKNTSASHLWKSY